MPPKSYQESAGPSKAAKFVQTNPLDPLIRPFADHGLSNEQNEFQQEISNNVNTRLERAMEELKVKHASGTNEIDAPEFAPTGSVYGSIYEQQRQLQQQQVAIKKQQNRSNQEFTTSSIQQSKKKNTNNDDHDDDDSDYDYLLEDDTDDNNDPVLEELRQRRITEMKHEQMKYAENIAKGHGQYRTITQDEFLPECTGSSEWIVVHFYHNDYQRCHIMDHHLQQIATHHIECKFIRIDANKAPFFVTKLAIKVLPTVLIFHNGKTIHRLVGFDGLITIKSSSSSSSIYGSMIKGTTKQDDPDQFETSTLKKWIAATGAIKYNPSDDEINDSSRQQHQQKISSVYRSNLGSNEYGDDL